MRITWKLLFRGFSEPEKAISVRFSKLVETHFKIFAALIAAKGFYSVLFVDVVQFTTNVISRHFTNRSKFNPITLTESKSVTHITNYETMQATWEWDSSWLKVFLQHSFVLDDLVVTVDCSVHDIFDFEAISHSENACSDVWKKRCFKKCWLSGAECRITRRHVCTSEGFENTNYFPSVLQLFHYVLFYYIKSQ